MTTPNLLALLQAAQAAQRSPSLAGPILPQTPASGFRAPPLAFAPPPHLSAPQQIDPEQIVRSFGGLAAALQRIGHEDPGMAAQNAATAADRGPGFFIGLLRSLGL